MEDSVTPWKPRKETKDLIIKGLAVVGLITVLPFVAGTLLVMMKVGLGLLVAGIALGAALVKVTLGLALGLIGVVAGILSALISVALGPCLVLLALYGLFSVLQDRE